MPIISNSQQMIAAPIVSPPLTSPTIAQIILNSTPNKGGLPLNSVQSPAPAQTSIARSTQTLPPGMTTVLVMPSSAQRVSAAPQQQAPITQQTPHPPQVVLSQNIAPAQVVMTQNPPPVQTIAIGVIPPVVMSAPQANIPTETFSSNVITVDVKDIFRDWKKYLAGRGTFQEITQFILSHPTFPKITVLREKAEGALEDPTNNAAMVAYVVDFFTKYPPRTGRGQFLFAKSLLAQGRIDQGKAALHQLLDAHKIPPEILQQLPAYKDYLPFLWAYLHASNMLYEQNVAEAKMMLPYLSADEKERVQLRIDLHYKRAEAITRAQEMIQKQGNNDAIIFDLIRIYRQMKTREADEAALKLFTSYSFLDEEQHAKIFWVERNILARRMMDARRPADAYALVKRHGFKLHKENHAGEIVCDEDCAHAHCMTGWLALEYVNKPEKALAIFKEVETVVKEAISKARAQYWIGASFFKLGNFVDAKKSFLEASTFSTTFYGQMAAGRVDDPALARALPTVHNVAFKTVLDVSLTEQDKRAFENLELVQVIRNIPEASRGSNCDPFFFALLKVQNSLEFQRQVFDLAESVKSRGYAILLSKKNHMTFKVAYPILKPATRKATIDQISPKSQFGEILPALSHAIIRRESGFDESALSSANAKGMMQLIDATANAEKKAIKRFGIHIGAVNLNNKVNNILLGTSHIDGLMEKYRGSMVLSLAAYNAGPQPISEWIATYGDPRDLNVDIVNWIESIPYAETRNYVQRVLENFMVYTQFLAEEKGETTTKKLTQFLR